MARLPRLAIAGQLHSLVHRAKPGVLPFAWADDRADYGAALLTTSREAQVAIHAYVLLPDRVQLLLTPTSGEALGEMMQRLGRRFSGAYNARHASTGGIWDGRYRVTVLEAATYLFDAICHVELAPLRAGHVDRPQDWPASSATHHLGLRSDPLITEHALYWSLGNTPFEREAAHRSLLDTRRTAPTRGAEIDQATLKAWALGSGVFIADLARKQARRLQPSRRGRPAKPSVVKREPESDPN